MSIVSEVRAQLLRSSAGIAAMRLLSFPATLLCTVILARALGPAQFGQYAFIMALVPLLGLPVTGALSRLLTREVATYLHQGTLGLYRGLLRYGLGWVGLYSLAVVVLVLGVLSLTEPADQRWQLLRLAVILVPVLGIAAILNGTIKGLGHVAASEAPSQIVQPFALLIALLVLAGWGVLNTGTAIQGQVAAALVAVTTGLIILAGRRPAGLRDHDPAYASADWSIALLPITLIALAGTLNAQVGVVLLGLLGSDESVAALRIADSGAKMVMISLGIVNMVIGPQIVRYRLDNDVEGLQALARHSARLALLVATPIALVFFAFGEPVIRIVFGAEYAAPAFLPLVILTFGQLVSVFFGSVGYLLTMSGHEQDTLRGQAIALVVNGIACILLIPAFGAVGAATAATMGLIVWNVLLARRVRQRLGIRSAAL